MLAGDIVYEHDAVADETRGELTEVLCDALEAVLGSETTTRLSNGQSSRYTVSLSGFVGGDG